MRRGSIPEMMVRPLPSRPNLSANSFVLESAVAMRKISISNCPYCGSPEVYRSRPKTFPDYAVLFLLLEPVRCHRCIRRHFRPIFLPTPEYLSPSAKRPLGSNADDKEKRSA